MKNYAPEKTLKNLQIKFLPQIFCSNILRTKTLINNSSPRKIFKGQNCQNSLSYTSNRH